MTCYICGNNIKPYADNISGREVIHKVEFTIEDSKTGEEVISASNKFCKGCYWKLREFINKEKSV